MKKTLLSLLALLLLCAILLPSCAQTKKEEEPEVVSHTENADGFLGIWYSGDEQLVLDFKKDGKVTLFVLAYGYYQYDRTAEGTYTVDEDIITVKVENETATYLYNSEIDELVTATDGGGALCERSETYPTKHASYPFPAYTNLECEKIMSSTAYRDLDVTEDAYAEAAATVFEEYYSDSAEDDLPAVSDRNTIYGDYISVTYNTYVDGELVPNGSALSTRIILTDSQDTVIPGLHEQLIDKPVGDRFDIELPLSKDTFGADYAGKTATLHVTIHKIYQTELDEETVTNAYMMESYTDVLNSKITSIVEKLIWAKVLGGATYLTEDGELPADCYIYYLQYYRDYYHYLAFYYGYPYEDVLGAYNITENDLLGASKQIAVTYVLAFSIAATEDLHYTEEQKEVFIDNYIRELMEEQNKEYEEIEANVKEYQMDYVDNELTYEIVTGYFRDNCFVKRTATESEETITSEE